MNGRKGDILYTYYICICIYTHIHICMCIVEYYSVTKRRNPAICDNMDNLGHLDTHRQGWVSLLWGHCSFLLGPGAHKVLFVPSKSLFPQSCVSSGGFMVGLMATSSKRAYAIPSSAAPRAPAPVAGHCWHVPPQETLKHSSVSVSVGSLGPHVHKVCLSPLSILVGMGFNSKCDFAPPTRASPLLLDVGYLLKVAPVNQKRCPFHSKGLECKSR